MFPVTMYYKRLSVTPEEKKHPKINTIFNEAVYHVMDIFDQHTLG